MNSFSRRILYFFLGLIGLFSLLCSIAASSVTNAALMKQGFALNASAGHLNVSPDRYADYAVAITDYLNGKTDLPRVPAQDGSGGAEDAFREEENAHLRDVRGIVSFLKWARWLGGGGAIALIAALYLAAKDRQALLFSLVRGFALAAASLLAVSAILAVWGAVNFDGLFHAFRSAVFSGSFRILSPETDLLAALTPLPFFAWYAGEMLKSMLPVLGLMLLLIVAYLKKPKEKKQ